jgi:hypothetical protein
MLRFALGAGARVGLRSPDESSFSGVAEAFVRNVAFDLAGLGATGGVAPGDAGAGALSVTAGDGCAAAPGAYTRAATDAKPSTRPAAAAATIVQRERPGRCDPGLLDVSDTRDTLDTYGASLSGAWLGGGTDSMTAGTDLRGCCAHALLLTGVGMARNVTFSLALSGVGSDGGGGGGMLERNRGMCSDWGASPPRTTTA